jgi:hypothetical protein
MQRRINNPTPRRRRAWPLEIRRNYHDVVVWHEGLVTGVRIKCDQSVGGVLHLWPAATTVREFPQ